MKPSCPSDWVEMIFLSLTPIDLHLPFSEIACCQPSTVNMWAQSASARLWCPHEQRLCQPHLCIPAQSGWMIGTRVSLVVLSVKDHLLLKVYKILCQGRARSGQQRKCSWEQVSLALEEDYIQGSGLAHSPSSQLCGRKEDMDQTHHPLTLQATLLLGYNEHLATCVIFDYVQNQSLQPGVPVYLSQA